MDVRPTVLVWKAADATASLSALARPQTSYLIAQQLRHSIILAGRIRRPWNVFQNLPRHPRQLCNVDRDKKRLVAREPLH